MMTPVRGLPKGTCFIRTWSPNWNFCIFILTSFHFNQLRQRFRFGIGILFKAPPFGLQILVFADGAADRIGTVGAVEERVRVFVCRIG